MAVRRVFQIGAFAVLVLAVVPAGSYGQWTVAEVNLRPPAGMESRSLGYVSAGGLRRAQRLRESKYIRHMPDCQARARFFGTWELLQLVQRAARRVAFRLPGAKLSVGELSAQRGGAVSGHRSHQNGRDVDLGFYLLDARGRTAYARQFLDVHEVRGTGRARAVDRAGSSEAALFGLRFDDARNWELVAKLVGDDVARVQYIFVAETIARRLLSYAQSVGASPELMARARTAMLQPDHGHPHRNHFHVRIYCSPDDRPNCKDQGPFWPWYPGEVPGGLFASLERMRHRVFE